MLSLSDIIRKRVEIQQGDKTRESLEKILTRAIWVYDNYDLFWRGSQNVKNPLKALGDKAITGIVNGVNRIFSKDSFQLLYPFRKRDIRDIDLYRAIDANKGITRDSLAEYLHVRSSQLTSRLRKEMQNWSIMRIGNKFYTTESRLKTELTLDDAIHTLLSNYPFLTIPQLCFITGMDQSRLGRPIISLSHKGEIKRGWMRENVPDEYFSLADTNIDDIVIGNKRFVASKRDLLVELIQQERYFKYRNANYWIFLDGVPQAEFDLIGKKGQYTVSNFSKLPTASNETTAILDEITQWGNNLRLAIKIDSNQEEKTHWIHTLTQGFLDRGYSMDTAGLELHLQEHVTTPTNTVSIYNWDSIGPWLRQAQFLDYVGKAQDILFHLVQLEQIESISYRLQTSPSAIEFENVVYIPGINHRLGFVHTEYIETIVRGWPKKYKLNFFDRRILGAISAPVTTAEIIAQVRESPVKIKQSLLFLEKCRKIRRHLPGSLSINSCIWVPFDYELPKINFPLDSKKEESSVARVILRILDNHPPLTIDQLSKFTGLSTHELNSILHYLMRRNEIVEGYYLPFLGKIQYTRSETLDRIDNSSPSTEYTISSQRVDILPINDQYAMLHLSPILLQHPSLLPTKQFDIHTTQWMIAWDGMPIGYLLKSPSIKSDYSLEIKLIDSMVTNMVISGILEKFVTLMRSWYGEEGEIAEINGVSIRDKKWESLYFLIESIGLSFG